MRGLHDISRKKVLVTGASGFIGTHLCKRLRGLGCEVHGVSRTQRASGQGVSQWWKSDLLLSSDVLEVADSIKPDIVFHLSSLVTGSRGPDVVLPIFHANLVSTVNLLSAFLKVGCERFVQVGSMEEPNSNKPMPASISPYAASKWSCSIYGRLFYSLYHLPVVIAHLFMVYGPGQMDLKKLIPYVTVSLLNNEAPILTSGSREVDWIYVDDLVDALIACLQAEGLDGKTVEIGSGELITVREIAENLASIIKSEKKPQYGVLEDRVFENVRVADVERSFGLLGWKARVQIREGLKRTVKWYREQMMSGAFQGLRSSEGDKKMAHLEVVK